jgi:hypothetical protein
LDAAVGEPVGEADDDDGSEKAMVGEIGLHLETGVNSLVCHGGVAVFEPRLRCSAELSARRRLVRTVGDGTAAD